MLLINVFQRLTKIIGDVKNDFGLRRERERERELEMYSISNEWQEGDSGEGDAY